MATKFYLSRTPATITPDYDAGWNDTAQAIGRMKLVTTKEGTALTATNFSDADVADRHILAGQWISEPLAAQTIPIQAITCSIKCSETSLANNLVQHVIIRVVESDGVTFRGTILSFRNVGTEFPTTAASRYWTANCAALAVSQGDRLVIEHGFGGDPGTTYTHNGSMTFGDSAANDLDAADGDTGDDSPWVNFATTVTFYTAPAPSGSAYAVRKFFGGIMRPILFGNAGGAAAYSKLLTVGQLWNIDLADLNAIQYATDYAVVRYGYDTGAGNEFNFFTQGQMRQSWFEWADISGDNAAAVLARAATNGVDELMPNFEGVSHADFLSHLTDLYTWVAGSYPVIACPIYFELANYYATHAAVCDGWAIQLQNQAYDDVVSIATARIAELRAVKPAAKIYLQIKSYDLTVSQIVSQVRALESLNFDGLSLFHGTPEANYLSYSRPALMQLRP